MRLIPLTQNKFAIVDDDDYEWLMQWVWTYRSVGYAGRYDGDDFLYMHQTVLRVESTMIVDHKNLDGLDNRKCNLRPASHSQNHANSPKRRGTHSSQYKGVSWFKRDSKWRAQIAVNYQNTHLGYFNSEQEAALAYNNAALLAWGSYARLNVIV